MFIACHHEKIKIMDSLNNMRNVCGPPVKEVKQSLYGDWIKVWRSFLIEEGFHCVHCSKLRGRGVTRRASSSEVYLFVCYCCCCYYCFSIQLLLMYVWLFSWPIGSASVGVGVGVGAVDISSGLRVQRVLLSHILTFLFRICCIEIRHHSATLLC